MISNVQHPGARPLATRLDLCCRPEYPGSFSKVPTWCGVRFAGGHCKNQRWQRRRASGCCWVCLVCTICNGRSSILCACRQTPRPCHSPWSWRHVASPSSMASAYSCTVWFLATEFTFGSQISHPQHLFTVCLFIFSPLGAASVYKLRDCVDFHRSPKIGTHTLSFSVV